MSDSIGAPRIPLSPSSPPETGYKQLSKRRLSETAPHTPVSPPFMSVATKSYVSSYENNRHTDEMAQRTPRSPSNTYAQTTPRITSSAQNPENSLKRPLPDDTEDRSRDKRQKMDGADHQTSTDNSSNPSNDMQAEGPIGASMIPGLGGLDGATQEEQIITGLYNSGHGPKKSGQVFLLSKSTVPRSLPDPHEHLLGKYELGSLLRSVARTDPSTGEKINKLRKSYEGQIKLFSLPGRNRPAKSERDEDMPGPLRALATIPESHWKESHLNTKPVNEQRKGVSTLDIETGTEFKAKLQKAMQLNPGTVRNNAVWEDILGHDKQRPIVAQTQSINPSNSRIPNGGPPQRGPVSSTDKRHTRGKKRSYGDSSFAGYGEGYSDGEGLESEGDYGDERRKRKKDQFTGQLLR